MEALSKTEEAAWFISTFLLAFRQKYQASNQDTASVLNQHAKQLGIELPHPFTGSALNRARNPELSIVKQFTNAHYGVMLDLYFARSLVPSRESGWHGLISVYQGCHPETDADMPQYLFENGLGARLFDFNKNRAQPKE